VYVKLSLHFSNKSVGLMFVSVVLLGCEDSVIVEAFKEVLSMLDEVCIFGVFSVQLAGITTCILVIPKGSAENKSRVEASCGKLTVKER